MECVCLRGHNLDFAYHQITVRDGKGARDRVTMLPRALAEPLQRHLTKVKLLHEEDLLAGYGNVYLPYAFERQEPHAGTAWVGNTSCQPPNARSSRARGRTPAPCVKRGGKGVRSPLDP